MIAESVGGERISERAGDQAADLRAPLEPKELKAFAQKVFENNQSLCARADQKLSFALAVGTLLTGGLLPLVKPTVDLYWCLWCSSWERWTPGGLLILSLIFSASTFLAIYKGVFPADSRHPNLTGARELVYGVHISRRPTNGAYLAEVRQLDQESELIEWVNQAFEVGHIEARKMRSAKAAFRALMLQGITEFCAWIVMQAVSL